MNASAAGYSGTPLLKKLGYRDGQRALFVGVPDGLKAKLGEPEYADCRWKSSDGPWPASGRFDVAHLFTGQRSVLADTLPRLDAAIEPDGMIWISWPKKAAKVSTDMSEDAVRAEALPRGLVDVKVCAVDAVWSGLKLVVRKELRTARH